MLELRACLYFTRIHLTIFSRSDPEDVTEARSGNAEAWAKLDFEPFRLRKYESDFRLFYWFGPKVTPELWRQSDFGHRWSLSATLIFIFGESAASVPASC